MVTLRGEEASTARGLFPRLQHLARDAAGTNGPSGPLRARRILPGLRQRRRRGQQTPPAEVRSFMIEGMSRAEILESLPEGFCNDCWQQSLERQKQFSTDPKEDYPWVYHVTHIWDGI